MQFDARHKVTITIDDIIAKLLPDIAAELDLDIDAADIDSAYDARKRELVLSFDANWEAEPAGEADGADGEYEHEITLSDGEACRDACDHDPPACWPEEGDTVQIELDNGDLYDAKVTRVDDDGDMYVTLDLDADIDEGDYQEGLIYNRVPSDRDYSDTYKGLNKVGWACERVVAVRW